MTFAIRINQIAGGCLQIFFIQKLLPFPFPQIHGE